MSKLAEPELLEGGTLLRVRLHAPKGNILSQAMMAEIAASLHEHQDDRPLRMVLLCAGGENFSFGASVEEHRREQAPAMLGTFHALIRTVAAYPLPIAALVQGQCLGGAFELVLACHFVFATPTARFACPEVKLAVFPPVLAAIGPHRLGEPLCERLLLTGHSLDAEAAHRAGLVCQLLAGPNAEEALLGWYRETLAPLSAFALRQATKASRRSSGLLQALQTALFHLEHQYVEEVLESRDGNEGIAAFLERRKPVWRDR